MDNETEPNCELPQKVFELSELYRVKKANGLRFTQKIFLALQLTEKNPELTPLVGAVWLNKTMFACNVEIFAHIIHIKRNSINKQFSQFGFKMMTSKEFGPQLDGLPGTRKWTVRYCVNPSFNKDANIDVLAAIEAKETSSGDGPEISAFVDPFIENLPNKNAVKALFDQQGRNVDFIEECVKEWMKITSECNNDLSIDRVVEVIISNSEEKWKYDVSGCIKFLLQNNICSSVVIKDVTFLDYYRLFLRFGRISRIEYSIASFINPETNEFYEWFRPTSEVSACCELQVLHVRLSNTHPTAFTLVINGTPKYLNCDPLAPADEMFSNETLKSKSISELLVKMGIIEQREPIPGLISFSQYSQQYSQSGGEQFDTTQIEEIF